MRIEDEIKQEQFIDEYQKAYINLVFTSSRLQVKQAALFKPYGLTLPQFNILRILRGQHPKPATITLLIERMMDKTSNASRIVDRLEAKKLVTRKQCSEDRRTVDVLITEKALKLLKAMDGCEGGKGTGIANLTETEARELNRILDKIRS
ncbi:MarR family winged helix-turn-helix transcriptional regulator [Pontibacter beigongshangensis]|uniref:MarR family winged helix-turn-helix transcriptional regulator n=1 Tax=Pontibacter beigongshangensis TaxID=2574733 RepID=UPI00164F9E68|nr:MarR family transcriptional regulator [Pontibacter beigongshangensis]